MFRHCAQGAAVHPMFRYTRERICTIPLRHVCEDQYCSNLYIASDGSVVTFGTLDQTFGDQT